MVEAISPFKRFPLTPALTAVRMQMEPERGENMVESGFFPPKGASLIKRRSTAGERSVRYYNTIN
jgi:hypothetical protein